MAKNYSEKLLDPRWQKKRLKILERDNFTCQHCKSTEDTLHVHHIAYFNNDPWETPDKLLLTLCADCHESESELLSSYTADLITMLKQLGFTSNDFYSLIEATFYIKEFRTEPINDIAEAICFTMQYDNAYKSFIAKYNTFTNQRRKNIQEYFNERNKVNG